MQVKLFLAAVSLFLYASAFAQFIDGNKLVQLSKGDERATEANSTGKDINQSIEYMGYIKGVIDANLSQLACLPERMTAGQAAAVVTKYLKENPERWNLSGNFLVVNALQRGFQCAVIKK